MSANQFLSPVGRIVQGDAMTPQTKDQQGALLTVKTGPNAGQPTQKFFIAVAFAKNDPAVNAFLGQLMGIARAAWPQLFNAQGQCTHPKFSSKIMDGDGVDDNGKPNSSKEGFAGHWVVKFSSSFPPNCFYTGRFAPHEQIQDKNVIRRGYYVRVAGTAEGNANQQRPGIYVNLGMIELVAQGQEIVSGPDAAATFGAAPIVGALPPGAMALPAPGAPAAYGAPVAPGGYQPPPTAQFAAPAAFQAPAAAPAAYQPPPLPVQPHQAFVAGAGAPPLPPGVALPAPPAAAPVRQMTAKAGGATYEQLVAIGWTDATLRSEGMMV